MSSIVVFGAGGRAGRRAVQEAVSRGHQVTAVVRDPAKYADLAGDNVRVVTGDVLDPSSVAEVVAGHDAVISAAARLDMPPAEFFGGAARALVQGLENAGVERLVLVGIGTTLEVQPGVALHDTPGFPEEGRIFSLGHQAELDVLRAEGGRIDWAVLAPPPVMLDAEAERTGVYRIGGAALLPHEGEGEQTFSYADLAVALIDEIETPKQHRTLAAVA